ncbi:unnamed protein product [Gulo gulo]|uniref:Uncharacterized protein n=1 Tax=Gulo gulo TaxID=48420 RepID=A0A9X9Q8N0_GULGU|nr:unnamed protein product [Gulo gulo]
MPNILKTWKKDNRTSSMLDLSALVTSTPTSLEETSMIQLFNGSLSDFSSQGYSVLCELTQ